MNTVNSNRPIKLDSEKTFDELIIDNERFIYDVVNKEFKQHFSIPGLKEDLYSAGKERISLCCN